MTGHRMTGRRRRIVLAVAAVVVIAVAAVVWTLVRAHRTTPALAHFKQTQDYLPGVAADLYLPAPAAGRTPTVVLIPGGGWSSADRGGLAPLADALAANGMVVLNATYRAADSGVTFPVPVADIVCAIDYAAAQARLAGFSPGQIVVMGHSSGAHLSALAALDGAHFRHACPYQAVEPDGLIGLSGPYDISQAEGIAFPLFGASSAAEPAQWREGNPMTWVGLRTGSHPLRVLLVHGSSDELVSTSFSETFAAALRRAGHPVQLTIIPGASHADVYRADVISGIATTWIRGLK
ncbi:Acetyl esterase/lipase [Nakamurella panacisegetis]|uniref:Acetyl esterase/lipase n=1 Tax=Nakamurella panacisegetis TaxID=1090615 RepID=A0A1H0T5R4_9ACTN|nr:alpha/beta hydrolase [Nakamurella panacisegetis]SDP48836.1 Acetyl esterase/lipase [Nakamurella panacisegetis]